jgi:hypothetical protein
MEGKSHLLPEGLMKEKTGAIASFISQCKSRGVNCIHAGPPESKLGSYDLITGLGSMFPCLRCPNHVDVAKRWTLGCSAMEHVLRISVRAEHHAVQDTRAEGHYFAAMIRMVGKLRAETNKKSGNKKER